MNQSATSKKPVVGQCLRLSGIDWKTYSRLLYAFAEKPRIRLTYDRGELEIMSPLLELDDDAEFFGALVRVLTEELGLPIRGGGSTTMRRRRLKRGLEADRCFWITNAHRMAGRRRLDLRTDPPPDLAIENDVTHSSLDRLSIYAALRVPEVWRLFGETLTFHTLNADGIYVTADVSRAFPMVTPANLLPFIQKARQVADDNAVLREFREWIRQRRTSGGSAPDATQA